MEANAMTTPKRVALALLITTLVGCQSGWVHRLRCPSPLRPVDALGADRELRTRAHIERGARRAVLDLVVEKYDQRLVVLARNELGVVAFVIAQRGRKSEVHQSLPARYLPLPPETLLADVQSVFFSERAPTPKLAISRCGYHVRFDGASQDLP